MSKYKVGDKIILTVTSVPVLDTAYTPYYILNDNFVISEQGIDKYAEPLSTYTEPLEAEITRLLAENKELKERVGKANKISFNGGRLAGQNEAWELARKITCQPINGGFNRSEFEEIFGYDYISDIFEKYKYTEATAKVVEWEKTKEEIKVGDIVRNKCNISYKFCVTDIDYDGTIYGINKDGATYSGKNPEDWEKTGRHIDIDSFLKQIGGEQE